MDLPSNRSGTAHRRMSALAAQLGSGNVPNSYEEFFHPLATGPEVMMGIPSQFSEGEETNCPPWKITDESTFLDSHTDDGDLIGIESVPARGGRHRAASGGLDPVWTRQWLYGFDEKQVAAQDAMQEAMTRTASYAMPDVATQKGMSLDDIRDGTRSRLIDMMNFPEWKWQANLGKMLSRDAVCSYRDVSVATKYAVHFFLFTGSIYLLGSEEQINLFAEDATSFKTPGCFAMTEDGHGSNVRAIQTTATFDPSTDEYIIHTPAPLAEKVYIGGGLDAKRTVVFARLITGDGEDKGPHAFVVPTVTESGERTPGITITDMGRKMGLNGVDNVRIRFNNVRIPRTWGLSRYGGINEDGEYVTSLSKASTRFNAMLGALTCCRISVVTGNLYGTRFCLATAIKYAHMRRQFGPDNAPELPIMSYPTTQTRLLIPLSAHIALTLMEKSIIFKVSIHDPPDRDMQALVAGYKCYATWMGNETMQNCRETMGGRGYMMQNLVAAHRTDLDIHVTFEGDNTVLYQQVAKDLLIQFGREAKSGLFSGPLAFLRRVIVPGLKHSNLVIAGSYDESHLRSYGFAHAALAYREASMLFYVAQELRARVKLLGPVAGWNSLLHSLIDLSRTHMERMLLELLDKELRKCPLAGTRAVLSLVRQLYGLSRIERSMSWYLEHGYVRPRKASAIRELVLKICSELRPHSLALVESFGIHPKLLSAWVTQPAATSYFE